MSLVSLSLLGGFELRLPSGIAVHLPTRKAQALLAYLAMRPGQAHSRDKLATLLWGDVPDGQARASLRQTLSLVGKALDEAPVPCLVTDARTIALVPAAVDVDVARFEAAVATAEPEALERATQLYRGDLLEGLVLDEAAFEAWLLSERERLREIVIEALLKVLSHHQAPGGSAERAIQTAVRLLALDPCEETVHCALMRLYARQGRHAAALRQYQVCVTALRRELNAEPQAETKRVYREILQRAAPAPSVAPSRSDPARAPSVTPHEGPAGETAIIGRDAELQQLTALLDEAWGGAPHIAVLVGEAGVGKTRLVTELGVVAGRRPGRVVVGRCYETEQILPFSPWVVAFRAAGVGSDAALVDTLPLPTRLTLGRLFPELTADVRELPTDADNPLRLFEALSQLAAILATRTPLLVVLEDLHWADDMTLRFLAFLGRRLPRAHLLVVGTARDDEIAQASSLHRILDELRSHPAFTVLSIAPLSSVATARLVEALTKVGTDHAAVAGLAAQIWQSSEGNPFVAVETMRAIDAGVLARQAGTVAVPGTVRELILRRLERLSGPARQLTAVTAVAGGPVDFALLQRASGLPHPAAAEGLEELVRHRVFHGVGEGFDFTHDRLRQTVDASLLAPRRETLHGAIGAALEALHEGALAPVYDRLAYHYARTDRSEKAVEYLAGFAEHAARAFAHTEAAQALEQALVHGERLPATIRDARLVELSLRLAFSLSLLGRYQDIVTVLGRQRARVDRLDRAELAGQYHFRVGLTQTYLGEQTHAADSARAALDHARRAGDKVTMGRAQYLLALKSYWKGELREGVECAREAVTLLDGSEERHFLGLAYWVLGLNHHLAGQFEAGLEATAHAQRLGQVLRDPRLQSFTAGSIGWIHATRGDVDAGIAVCAEALDLARDPLSRALASSVLGYAYVAQGNADAAIPILERSAGELMQLRMLPLESRCTAWLADAHVVKGELTTARRLADNALQTGESADYWYSIAWAHRVLARLAYLDGDRARAEAALATAVEVFTRVGAAFEVGRAHLIVAELAHARGDRPTADRHLAEATRWLMPLDVPRYHERVRGLAKP